VRQLSCLDRRCDVTLSYRRYRGTLPASALHCANSIIVETRHELCSFMFDMCRS